MLTRLLRVAALAAGSFLLSAGAGDAQTDRKWPETVPIVTQRVLEKSYLADSITILGAWATPDGRYLAIATRSDIGSRSLGFDLWNLPISLKDTPIAATDREPGEGTFGQVVFEDMSGDESPELLAVVWIEEGGFPLFFARMGPRWVEFLQANHRREIPGPLGQPDRVKIRRLEDRVCAFAVPVIPVGGRSVVPGAPYDNSWQAPLKWFSWDGNALLMSPDPDDFCGL